jgi:hypothetical protein
VEFLAGLLAAERVQWGTRTDTRSLSCHDQAVLVLRWFLDGTRMKQLAPDNGSASRPAKNICTRASTYWLLGRRVCTTPAALPAAHLQPLPPQPPPWPPAG